MIYFIYLESDDTMKKDTVKWNFFEKSVKVQKILL